MTWKELAPSRCVIRGAMWASRPTRSTRLRRRGDSRSARRPAPLFRNCHCETVRTPSWQSASFVFKLPPSSGLRETPDDTSLKEGGKSALTSAPRRRGDLWSPAPGPRVHDPRRDVGITPYAGCLSPADPRQRPVRAALRFAPPLQLPANLRLPPVAPSIARRPSCGTSPSNARRYGKDPSTRFARSG